MCVRCAPPPRGGGKGVMPIGTTASATTASRSTTTWAASTLQRIQVVAAVAAKINPTAMPSMSCLLGCGVTHGIAAVSNTASSARVTLVAIFGPRRPSGSLRFKGAAPGQAGSHHRHRHPIQRSIELARNLRRRTNASTRRIRQADSSRVSSRCTGWGVDHTSSAFGKRPT